MYLSMNFRLTVITYVGFSVSICCMLLAILLFSLQGAGSTERDVIHLNLCISLLREPATRFNVQNPCVMVQLLSDIPVKLILDPRKF